MVNEQTELTLHKSKGIESAGRLRVFHKCEQKCKITNLNILRMITITINDKECLLDNLTK